MPTLLQICTQLAAWLAEPSPQNPHWPAEAWPMFRHASRVHGVAPLLHEKLAAVTWFDAETRHWLAEQYRHNRARIARMHRELADILRLLGQAGIAAMPLKGAILTARYYPDPGLRPMADLDLLLHPPDFDRAARLLPQLGYQPTVPHWKHTEFTRPDNRTVVSPDAEHPDNPRRLEIHRHCRESFGGPQLDLTALMWREAGADTLLDAPAWLPSPEALWLHLLIHCSYHFWQGRGRLIQLCDLAQLAPRLNHPLPAQIDPRFTYPALALLEKYFSGTIPASVRPASPHPVSARFRGWVAGWDLVNRSYLDHHPPGLYLSRALNFADGQPGDILRAWRFALLPHLAELALDHPRLAQSPAPWLAYGLLPLDWWKRLRSK